MNEQTYEWFANLYSFFGEIKGMLVKVHNWWLLIDIKMELKFMYNSYASEILLGAKYSISIEISNTHAHTHKMP